MQPRTSLWKFGNLDGNSEIWTGENSYCNFQISVEIGNLNCGASKLVAPAGESIGRPKAVEGKQRPEALRRLSKAVHECNHLLN